MVTDWVRWQQQPRFVHEAGEIPPKPAQEYTNINLDDAPKIDTNLDYETHSESVNPMETADRKIEACKDNNSDASRAVGTRRSRFDRKCVETRSSMSQMNLDLALSAE